MRRIFWGFCINWILKDPLHYLSSHSDFGPEYAEIFVIKKRLPDSARLPIVAIFFKPLYQPMVMVLYNTSLAYFLLNWFFKGLV
jgi:hypothetical protein